MGAVVFVGITTPLSIYYATRGGGPVTAGDLARFVLPYAVAVVASLGTVFYLKPWLPPAPLVWIPLAGLALLGVFALPILISRTERTEIGLLILKIRARVASALGR